VDFTIKKGGQLTAPCSSKELYFLTPKFVIVNDRTGAGRDRRDARQFAGRRSSKVMRPV